MHLSCTEFRWLIWLLHNLTFWAHIRCITVSCFSKYLLQKHFDNGNISRHNYVFYVSTKCTGLWVGGNGSGVGGSGLSLLLRDLSTICQAAPSLCAWSLLMKSRCFPSLLLPSRTSPASLQPTLAHTQINIHVLHT